MVAPQPAITKLTPKIVAAGAPTTTITVDGANFAADAQVLWDGAPLPTTFVNGSRVKVQAPRALLAIGGAVGLAVRNQTPVEAVSDQAIFTVAAASNAVFMPQMRR
ncbi:MAG: IPT/TIG domain-containing protein [Anaerolineales bacterium]|nr:IPT/TIG domain-containing protein [Anaerolineales bacterium]